MRPGATSVQGAPGFYYAGEDASNPAHMGVMNQPMWHQKTPARWIVPPSLGSGDRRLILAEVLFLPVRMIAAPIFGLRNSIAYVRSRIGR